MKANRIAWGIVSLVVMVTIVVSYGTPDGPSPQSFLPQSQSTPAPEIKDTRDLSKYGVVAYDTPEIENPREWERRRQINQRYDNQEWVYKTATPGVAGIGRIQDLEPPPLFPTEESVLIVVGEVVMANAFLSNDRECVYTEFTIRIDELLKNSSGNVNPKKVIADREGGVVVYPNGQRLLYQSSERGLPSLGSKYLFFLVQDGQSPNYRILTSYDVNGGRIRQMEIGHPLDEFKDASKSTFIEAVRNKVARVRS